MKRSPQNRAATNPSRPFCRLLLVLEICLCLMIVAPQRTPAQTTTDVDNASPPGASSKPDSAVTGNVEESIKQLGSGSFLQREDAAQRLLFLGAAQGFMGWYMVQSGLVDIPAVSHFRLAAHLSLAFIIAGLLLWLGLSLLPTPPRNHSNRPLFIHAICALIILGATITWGAFTAGLDAGLIYNESFPKMGGQWLPPDFWKHDTLWENITHHHSAIQFTHRWLAMLTVIALLSLWLHGLAKHRAFPAFHALALISLLQLGLGIATLLSKIHIHIAATHQAGAVIVFALLIICLFQTRAQK